MGLYGSALYLSEEDKNCLKFEADAVEELNEAFNPKYGTGGKLRPIFTVLIYGDGNFEKLAEKFVKGQSYWHAGLAFNTSLNPFYSFNITMGETNAVKGGLSYENIEEYKEKRPNGTLFVGCILVKQSKYAQVKKALNFYKRNQSKTRYSQEGLIKSLFHIKTKNGMKFSMVCSEFVDAVLKQANIDISHIDNSNLVKPDDLRGDEKDKVYKVYEGKLTEFSADKINKIVEKLVDDESLNFFGSGKKG